MRMKSLLLALTALVGFSAAPVQPVAADGMKDRKATVTRKHTYHRPAYEFAPDRYAYRYEPRGYYPYYNAGYWAPADYIRARNRAHYYDWIDIRPPYFESWGSPRRDYHHREWHDAHHGRIRRHRW